MMSVVTASHSLPASLFQLCSRSAYTSAAAKTIPPRLTSKKYLARDAFVTKSCPKALHLIDDECIQLVAKAISPLPQSDSATIVECSPGPGFLTSYLLQLGVKKLHLFEHYENDYLSLVQKIAKQNDDRVTVNVSQEYVIDYVRDLRHHFRQLTGGTVDSTAIRGKWKDDPAIKIFLPLPPFSDNAAVISIVQDLCKLDAAFVHGRSKFFLMVSFRTLCSLCSSPTERAQYYSYLSVMSQVMFETQVIDRVPVNAFIPKIVRRRGVGIPDDLDPYVDGKNLFFISMTPKASLIDELPIEHWSDFRFLVMQAMIRKSGFVIQFFEKYFPNCGARLIRIGVPLYSKFSEMTSRDFLRIFNECLNWPEYSTSTFKMASVSFADEFDHSLEEQEEDDGVEEIGSTISASETQHDSVFSEHQ